MAKWVRAEPALMGAFDAGIAGLADRLSAMPQAREFNREFAAFIARHGHRGPNDWEMSSRTWENTPDLALVAIDRMRLADYDLSPQVRLGDVEQQRQQAFERVWPHVKLMDRGNFKKALKAAPHWARAREATRDRAIRSMLPPKRVLRELVRRAAQRGGVDDVRQVAMLRYREEFPRYLRDPSSLMATLNLRKGKRSSRCSLH